MTGITTGFRPEDRSGGEWALNQAAKRLVLPSIRPGASWSAIEQIGIATRNPIPKLAKLLHVTQRNAKFFNDTQGDMLFHATRLRFQPKVVCKRMHLIGN